MKEELIKVAVVGGNQEGLETVALLTADRQTQVMMVAEPNTSALAYHLRDFGFTFADHHHFKVTPDLQALTTFPELHLIIDASGDPKVHRDLQQLSIPHAVIFNGQCARFLWELRLIQGSDADRKAFILERIKAACDSIDLSQDWTELCELLIQVSL